MTGGPPTPPQQPAGWWAWTWQPWPAPGTWAWTWQGPPQAQAPRLATAGSRLGAGLIDLGVLVGGLVGVLIVTGIALSAGGATHQGDLRDNLGLSVVLAIAYAGILAGAPLYFALGWRGDGTVGMRALHLKVVDAASGAPPDWRQCVLRLAGMLWCLLSAGAGFAWALVDRRRRGWHDRLASTEVLHREPLPWWMAPGAPPPGAAAGPAIASPTTPAPHSDTEPRAPWTWTDVLPVLVLFYPASIGISFALGGTVRLVNGGPVHGSTRAALIGLLDLLSYGTDLLLLYGLLRWRRHGRLADLGWRRPDPRWLIAAVPLGVATYLSEIPLALISQALFPGTPNNQCSDIKDAFGSLVAVAILTTVVIAPIAEETVFRGFVLGWLKGRVPAAWAVVLSAALFSAAHFAYGQPTVFLPIFGTGVMLGAIYVLSRSIWTGMIVHGTLNLFVTLLLFNTTSC